MVGLQRGKSRGDQDRSTHAASRLQLNGGPRIELSANRVHRRAEHDDEHEAGEGARLPRDALHHPLNLPDTDAGGVRPAPRAAAARRTGYTGGITQLQRVAVGFLAASVAPAVAAVVERKRKDTVAAGGHISLFWLAPQFAVFGIADMFTYDGLMEFFYS